MAAGWASVNHSGTDVAIPSEQIVAVGSRWRRRSGDAKTIQAIGNTAVIRCVGCCDTARDFGGLGIVLQTGFGK